jgi:hypothetical protein
LSFGFFGGDRGFMENPVFFLFYICEFQKKMNPLRVCVFLLLFGGQAALLWRGAQWIAPMRGDRRAEKRDQN